MPPMLLKLQLGKYKFWFPLILLWIPVLIIFLFTWKIFLFVFIIMAILGKARTFINFFKVSYEVLDSLRGAVVEIEERDDTKIYIELS